MKAQRIRVGGRAGHALTEDEDNPCIGCIYHQGGAGCACDHADQMNDEAKIERALND